MRDVTRVRNEPSTPTIQVSLHLLQTDDYHEAVLAVFGNSNCNGDFDPAFYRRSSSNIQKLFIDMCRCCRSIINVEKNVLCERRTQICYT